MYQELARKLPAYVINAEPLHVTAGLMATERPIPRGSETIRRRTPADWPWYVWVPILIAPAMLSWLTILIIVDLL